ncbi:hypothetical protein [Streptomyces sp. NPDC001492]
MSVRGEVFLGDLVKAMVLLRPRDPATEAAVAELLHLSQVETDLPVLPAAPGAVSAVPLAPGAEESRPAPSPTALAGHDRPDRDRGPLHPTATARRDAPRALPSALPGLPHTAPRPAALPLDFTLARTRLPSADERAAYSAPDEHVMADLPDEDTRGSHHLSAPEPPWSPEWARGVMVAAVSAPVASRRLDQRALLRKVSRQQVLRSVPWQRRPSTRRGVQLLLDHGQGMAPFQDDRQWLRALLESVAGRDRVEVLRFTGSPLRGVVRAARSAPEPYRPPAPGTPVVLVSDLGRISPPFTNGAAARPDEWPAFVDGVLRCGCPPVVLTPFPAAVYPPSLRGRVALIPFDRRISLRYAREATRTVHRLLEERL